MAEESKYQNPKTLEPRQFPVSTVRVQDVVAKLLVVIHDNPEEKSVEVSVQGETDLVDAIEVKVEGDTLLIKDNGRDISVGEALSTSWMSSVGRTLMPQGAGKSGEVRITRRGGKLAMRVDSKIGIPAQVLIRVPQGTSIQVADVRGRTEIGDTLGPLSVKSGGVASVHAGKVRNTDVSLGGTGHVIIEEVAQWFAVNVTGSGSVRVNGGEVEEAYIRLSGTGGLRFGGHAKYAEVSMSGTGDVYVAGADRVRRGNSGLGHLDIGKKK